MGKLFKNLSYQALYQILAICLPIITTPYISRVIGADGLGVYSFTYSIVNYFTVFAMLGVLNYGSKVIATVKDDVRTLTKTFWEVYALQLASSAIALFGYLVIIFILHNNYRILLIQTLWIISCVFDISWFFFGIENFKVTVIRNTVIKLLTVVAIFTFVKNPSDLWKYVIIMSAGTLFSQLALWPFLFRVIRFYKPTLKGVFFHLKPNLLLFFPLLAISVYHTMDKTMLGLYSTFEQTGFYYNADKVINVPLSLITATGKVMLPRMSALVSEGKKEEERNLFNLTLDLFLFLTFAMSFGIASIAPEFIPVFFGQGFEECIRLTYVFAIIMIIKSLSSIIRNQYLIPNNAEKLYTYSVIAGAILNFICNYIFLVSLGLGAIGATLGTLVAEFTTCLIYVIFVHSKINLLQPLVKSLSYIIPGLIMYVIVRACSLLDLPIFIKLIVETGIGVVIYLVFSYPILKQRRTMYNLDS